MFVDIVALALPFGVAFILLLAARGLLPMALSANDSTVYHLSSGIALILLAGALRTLYWDALPTILDLVFPGLSALWKSEVGRLLPNLINGVICIMGARHLLIVQLMLIPERDRHHYTIWTAPFYPKRMCLTCSIDRLRDYFRGPK